MENYEHIFYLDCPHFTVGHVDQWGEQGYLLYEGNVYAYEEDRKDQIGRTYSRVSITDFLTYAERNQVAIPTDFMERLTPSLNFQNKQTEQNEKRTIN
jgi:hypothetical protein